MVSATFDLATAASRFSWIALVAAFGFFSIWETFRPWRELRLTTARRWFVNVTLWTFGGLCWRWISGVGAVAVAVLASRSGQPSGWWWFALTIPVLDFARYGFHRAAHALPWFWRVHRVHHSDPEVDGTSGLRFHPLEAMAEHVWVIAWVYALALPPLAVAVSVLLTNVADIAEHANISLPHRLESVLRLVIVTPETHRTHHFMDQRDHGRTFRVMSLTSDTPGSIRLKLPSDCRCAISKFARRSSGPSNTS